MNMTLLKQRLDLQRNFENLYSFMNESEQLNALRKIDNLNDVLREENLKREQNV